MSLHRDRTSYNNPFWDLKFDGEIDRWELPNEVYGPSTVRATLTFLSEPEGSILELSLLAC